MINIESSIVRHIRTNSFQIPSVNLSYVNTYSRRTELVPLKRTTGKKLMVFSSDWNYNFHAKRHHRSASRILLHR